jgi:hypothetical protein
MGGVGNGGRRGTRVAEGLSTGLGGSPEPRLGRIVAFLAVARERSFTHREARRLVLQQ